MNPQAFSLRAAPSLLVAGLVLCSAAGLAAQPLLPTDVGTIVNGFQDDFNGTAAGSNWVVSGVNVFSVSNGVLHVDSATGDPNHLLYEAPGYNNSVQEVLARVRVLSFGSGDLVRGGIGAAVDPVSTRGVNYLFRNINSEGQVGNHMAFLDDMVVWGPGQNFTWQPNTWYWVRLRHEPNAAALGGVNDVFGKIWLGDGTQAEPANWQLVWDYTPSYPALTGYAGITASSGGAFVFDVDYILIKASGLPPVLVAPNTFVQTPVILLTEPQNQTVTELQPATFAVGVQGNPAPACQWYRGASPIPGATNATYSIASAALTDNGAQFYAIAQNLVSNVTYAVTSSVVSLTVIADTNPPVLLGAHTLGLTQVQIELSKRITPTSATNLSNFTITSTNGNPALLSAALDATQTNILLQVSALTEEVYYTVTLNNLSAQTAAGTVIAPNSQASFVASRYLPLAIGNAPLPGGLYGIPNGLGLTSGGADIGGTQDQCLFAYQPQVGDFDVTVNLAGLSLSDPFAKAGLMARETLDPSSRFAAALTTPSMMGDCFESRDPAGSLASVQGRFPANFPNTWLRLKRAGNAFSGFASYDGQIWTSLGTATISMPSQIYLGLTGASHNTNQITAAQFVQITNVASNSVIGTADNPSEPLGVSSRKTPVVISEIMYHPAPRPDGLQLEFIELYNSNPWFQDVSGYQLNGTTLSYTFPTGTIIPGGGFLVVAAAPADLMSAYGITNVAGPFTGSLKKSDTIQLTDEIGAVLLTIPYSNTAPWPVAADGTGHSLVLARPTYGEGDPRAWDISDVAGGSPGAMECFRPSPLRQVRHQRNPGAF